MQHFHIRHATTYGFKEPVIIGTHRLLIRPREDHDVRIISSELEISPAATVRWHRDVDDNSVAVLDFSEAGKELNIVSTVTVQHFNEDPLDFVVSEFAVHFPFAYPASDRAVLAPYIVNADPSAKARLQDWLGQFWQPGQRIQTYAVLQRLCAGIKDAFDYQVREAPGVQGPLETLDRGVGSCRDFANLFIETVRCLGLAARFVSGYLYVPGLGDTPGSTHAWAEVFLPGAGWTGFDPTTGEIAGADHITTAVSRLPDAVPPISGTYIGPPEAVLTVGVWVTAV